MWLEGNNNFNFLGITSYPSTSLTIESGSLTITAIALSGSEVDSITWKQNGYTIYPDTDDDITVTEVRASSEI